MTRLIKYPELSVMGDFAVYFSKDDNIGGDDLLIAQSNDFEQWYDVHSHTTPSFCAGIKTGYTMYILTKHQK